MTSSDIVEVALSIDRLILESRMKDIALLAQADRSDRVGALAAVISKLRAGAYLLGCGPYCCGVLPLTVDGVVLGRPASPLEEVPATVVDYPLNDAVWMIPREASRVHATILRQKESGATTYWIRDEKSRMGTFVNGRRVMGEDATEDLPGPVRLAGGDVVTLGPSGVNVYVFIEIG